jgi:hypothetical protein
MAVCVALTVLLLPARGSAQDTSPDTIGPMRVVRELFAAMKAGDSARVRAVFHPQMKGLASATVGRNGEALAEFSTVDAFVTAMGTPHTAVYDERISRPRILVDGGRLASVWADYTFFLGTKLTHCGVDIFQLAKVGSDWKIVALSDTRRTTECTM